MFIATPGLTGVLDGERIESNVEKQGGFAGLESRFPRLHEYRRMFQNLGKWSSGGEKGEMEASLQFICAKL